MRKIAWSFPTPQNWFLTISRWSWGWADNPLTPRQGCCPLNRSCCLNLLCLKEVWLNVHEINWTTVQFNSFCSNWNQILQGYFWALFQQNLINVSKISRHMSLASVCWAVKGTEVNEDLLLSNYGTLFFYKLIISLRETTGAGNWCKCKRILQINNVNFKPNSLKKNVEVLRLDFKFCLPVAASKACVERFD